MSAAEKALEALEADTKAMGDEAREIAAYNGDSHLLTMLPSAALRRERYTLAISAVARAAMEYRKGYGCEGVLWAALDALEAAAEGGA